MQVSRGLGYSGYAWIEVQAIIIRRPCACLDLVVLILVPRSTTEVPMNGSNYDNTCLGDPSTLDVA